MILQTGQRTDIPAFYAEWFANRIQDGYVLVRNPYHKLSVKRYILHPTIIDGIIFCSKNPEPMLTHMKLLASYRQYWHVTITGYGKDIEPNVPSIDSVIKTFKQLSNYVSPYQLVWRYDPIFFTSTYTLAYHLRTFNYIAKQLKDYTDTVIVSFIDLYPKVRRNFSTLCRPTKIETYKVIEDLVTIANFYGMKLKTCGELIDYTSLGADTSGCFNKNTFERAFQTNLILPNKPPARKQCNCFIHDDIGIYNSCGHFCRYCYANTDIATVRYNMKQHNSKSPFLIGTSTPLDIIYDASESSWVDNQMRLEF